MLDWFWQPYDLTPPPWAIASIGKSTKIADAAMVESFIGQPFFVEDFTSARATIAIKIGKSRPRRQ